MSVNYLRGGIPKCHLLLLVEVVVAAVVAEGPRVLHAPRLLDAAALKREALAPAVVVTRLLDVLNAVVAAAADVGATNAVLVGVDLVARVAHFFFLFVSVKYRGKQIRRIF